MHVTLFVPPGCQLRPLYDCGFSLLPDCTQLYFRHVNSVTESSTVLNTVPIAYAS